MFDAQFADLVEKGLKRQTIRQSLREAVGDTIECRAWVGPGYRPGSHQRTLITGVVIHTEPVRILTGAYPRGGFLFRGERLVTGPALGAFVLEDGFASIEDFFAYFARVRPDVTGHLIQWSPHAQPLNPGSGRIQGTTGPEPL